MKSIITSNRLPCVNEIVKIKKKIFGNMAEFFTLKTFVVF